MFSIALRFYSPRCYTFCSCILAYFILAFLKHVSLKKEILRKLFHLMEIPVLLGHSIIRYYWSEKIAILALTGLFLLLLEIEYIRLEIRPRLPRIMRIFRPRERNNVTGTVFFIASTIIVFGVFDYSIALLALLLTVFGDFASALVGIRFGKHKLFKKKTFEGFLAGLVTNLLIGFLVLPDYFPIFLTMAVVASVVELLTNKLDDNLTVPLFAGFTGQMVAYLLSINLSAFPGPLEWFFKLLPT